MRLLPALILVWLMSLTAAAASDGTGPQVEAAKADAIESLKRQIIASKVSPDLTVADLIDKLDGAAEMNRALNGAEQLGDARWLGDEAVQVRLSIDGSRISRMLMKLFAHTEAVAEFLRIASASLSGGQIESSLLRAPAPVPVTSAACGLRCQIVSGGPSVMQIDGGR